MLFYLRSQETIRTISVVLCAFLFVGAAGCASGKSYAEMKSLIPPLKDDMGRIYFYRKVGLTANAAIKPYVFLNKVNVGLAVPQGFLFVDRPPGEYQVLIETEVERIFSFVLAAGETRYVRVNSSLFGFFGCQFYGELVEENKAIKEIEKCKYIGTPLVSIP